MSNIGNKKNNYIKKIKTIGKKKRVEIKKNMYSTMHIYFFKKKTSCTSFYNDSNTDIKNVKSHL